MKTRNTKIKSMGIKVLLFPALLRISLGWIFFWAFIDKLFGLNFSTSPDKSWLNGTSPTTDFLKFGTGETFKPFFSTLAGNPLIDWLFMLGLLGIGMALLLGIARKISTLSATLLLFLIWLSVLPTKNNPFIDEHIVYILALQVLFHIHSGEVLGFGKWWNESSLVKKHPFLS